MFLLDDRAATRIGSSRNRVLIIDDETILLEMLETLVSMMGYETVVAADVDEAEGILTRQGTRAFSCVLTDYKMPNRTGLELLRWLRRFDGELAIIVNTGYASHSDVSAMIREGAVDVLRKPVEMDALQKALEHGVKLTRERRKKAKAQKSVEQLGLVQQYMLQVLGLKDLGFADVCFRPVHQAGGDFASCYKKPGGGHILILADVAGHDLDAAYISAYFHGVAHGMIQAGQPASALIADFNNFLEQRWNNRPLEAMEGAAPDATVCALVLDLPSTSEQGLCIHNNGVPPPLLTVPGAQTRRIGEANSPLGLYEDPETVTTRIEAVEGEILAYSDGLEDYARQEGVAVECAAFRLLAEKADEQERLLAQAPDDVLVLRVRQGQPQSLHRPLILETHAGDTAHLIDHIEDGWSRSLQFALPALPQDRLYAILLTAREALLNALRHGCQGRADKQAILQMHVSPGSLRLTVEDPGPGYSDNFLTCPDPDMSQERHSGLILIRNFPDHVQTAKNNAIILADFTVI